MKIRKATKKDLDAIQRLDIESINYHKKFDRNFYTISKNNHELKKKSFLKELNNKHSILLIAESNKDIIGYSYGHILPIGIYKMGKVQDIVVTAKYRKMGVGKKLIKTMIEFFKENKCSIVEVEIFSENSIAKKFYEKSGFNNRMNKLWLKFDKKFKPFA